MERATIKKDYSSKEVEELTKEKIEGLKKDADVYALIQKLGLTSREVKKYLALLLNYQEDRAYCKNCPGLESCGKYAPGYQISLSYEDGIVERSQSPCPIYRKQHEIDATYLRRDFKDKWLEESLKTIDRTGAREAVIKELVKVANGKSKRWVYLKGKNRSGKSILLAALCNTFIALKDGPVCFASTPNLVNELRELSIKDKESFDEKMNDYLSCKIMVLDDFGDEYKSEFSFSTVLLPLLKGRLQNGGLTFFGSEFTFEEIEQMYEGKVGKIMAKQLEGLLKVASISPMEVKGVDIYR